MKQIASMFAFFVMLAFACGKETERMSKDRTATESLRDVERELGVRFPPSTRLIGVERQNGMDDMIRAKLEISSAELDAFLASTPVPPESLRTGVRGLLGSDHGFWDPKQAKSLRSGQAHLAGERAFNIGVAEGGPNTAVLYIVNHGT